MEKTFAQKVKSELCEPRVERKCCAVAEAYGVLLYAHSFSAKQIRITTASDEFAARLPHLMRRAFGIDFDEPESARGVKHCFRVEDPAKLRAVFDVRFLPNPFYVEELKLLSGLDAPVRDYVFSFEQSNIFMDKLTDMIEYLLPLYIEEGKYSLTIAIGCTGGRHRSVAVASALAGHLKCFGVPVVSINRDMNK